MSPGAVLKFQFSCVRVIQAAASAVLLGRVLLPALSAGHPHTPLSESTRRSRDERDRLPPWAVSLDFSPRHPSEPGDLSNQGEFRWQANQSRNPASPSRGAEMRLDVIRLHAVGLTYSEIAGQLGISRNTVASAVFKYKNPAYVRKYARERKRKVKPVQAKRPEKAAKPKLPKRPRGRPIGTGIDDSAHIEKLKKLSAKTGLKPTALIRKIGFSDPSDIRRIRDKFKSITAPLG